MPYMYIGHDPAGVARVYGHDETEAGAIVQTRIAAREYLRIRPDCGPLSRWTFEPTNEEAAEYNPSGFRGWEIDHGD